MAECNASFDHTCSKLCTCTDLECLAIETLNPLHVGRGVLRHAVICSTVRTRSAATISPSFYHQRSASEIASSLACNAHSLVSREMKASTAAACATTGHIRRSRPESPLPRSSGPTRLSPILHPALRTADLGLSVLSRKSGPLGHACPSGLPMHPHMGVNDRQRPPARRLNHRHRLAH